MSNCSCKQCFYQHQVDTRMREREREERGREGGREEEEMEGRERGGGREERKKQLKKWKIESNNWESNWTNTSGDTSKYL